jgi:hypothetical protein
MRSTSPSESSGTLVFAEVLTSANGKVYGLKLFAMDSQKEAVNSRNAAAAFNARFESERAARSATTLKEMGLGQ